MSKMRVTITPVQMLEILTKIDAAGLGWWMEGFGPNPHNVQSLVLNVDNDLQPHQIILRADGTWHASSEIEVGED